MDSPLETREKITGQVAISPSLQKEALEQSKTVALLAKNFKQKEGEDTSSLLALLLAGALNLDVSDIHAEPSKEQVKIRFRIDGLLQDVEEISKTFYQTLVSRIKLVSGIKLNIADRPQDGRFSLIFPTGAPIEIRASTLPSEYGESIMLRILNPKSLLTLKELGLRADLQDLFEKEIKKPTGMIMVTGPTGSGKTTTLYAFLSEVRNSKLKIITIEDPIEYHLEGISQTQVNPEKGYDFASGLRAIVRQDPDVVLVGEIRDGETADIALQAALTGHLVFSTLHTNDAAGAIPRLLSLGANAALVGPALNMIIAQRLVRLLCKDCKKKHRLTDDEKKMIEKIALAKIIC